MPREVYRGEVSVSFTLCVERRVSLFADEEVTAALLGMLREASERWSCLVVAYCFMPDHLHLVLHGRSSAADLWKMVVDFKQRGGYWLGRWRPGVSWQKDFHDHVMREGEDLAAHVRYVLDNPRRKGLVARWEDYPWKGAIGCRLEDVLDGLPL